MLNIGLSEMLLIAILVIVFVGPDDLPKFMRLLGRNYAKLRRASEDLRRAFNLEVDKVESERRMEEIRRRREELLTKRREEAGVTPTVPRPTHAELLEEEAKAQASLESAGLRAFMPKKPAEDAEDAEATPPSPPAEPSPNIFPRSVEEAPSKDEPR